MSIEIKEYEGFDPEADKADKKKKKPKADDSAAKKKSK